MKQMTPVTKEDIKKGLIKLGLKKGDIIGVHSSLSQFGYVIGGADAVIDALLEIAKKAP
jgi:aminoglycoside 3-N-acetyltransferase